MLFDSGAEILISDTTFSRKVGCFIDESRTQECVGSGSAYMAVGRTKIKITLDGSLVYILMSGLEIKLVKKHTRYGLHGSGRHLFGFSRRNLVSTRQSSRLFGWEDTAILVNYIGNQA